MTFGERDGYVLIKTESTYGTDAAPVVGSDLKYVEDLTYTGQNIMIPRTGISPHRAGFRPVLGVRDVTFSYKQEITPITFSDPPTERPPESQSLLMCGFSVAQSSPAADPDVITYSLAIRPTGSATIWVYEHNDANTNGWIHKLTGCRADWAIDIPSQERWMLEVTSGMAQAATHAAAGGARDALTYTFPGTPVVSGAAEVTLMQITDDKTYTTAALAGRVVSCRVQGNSGVQMQRGVQGQRSKLEPAEPCTMSLSVEVRDLADWDAWAYQAAPKPFLIQIGSPDRNFTVGGVPTGSGDYVLLRAWGYIMSIVPAADSGAKVWNMEVQCIWPEVGTDEGGLVPASPIQLLYGTKA